jgi:hypothetical protein
MNNNGTRGLEFHKLAEFYPMQEASRFHELVEGMRQSGYRDEFPIVLYEGKILDGRNRYKASQEAGVEPFIVQFSGDDPMEFVIQANSNRRDLEPGQRVAIAKKLREYWREKGKANMSEGGRDKGLSNLTNHVDARKEAAKAAGVSTGTVAMVDVIEKTSPELFDKVARGEMSTNKAYKKAKEIRRFEQHAQLVELAETVKPSDRWSVFAGDIRTAKLDDELDAIITDPPYPKEYLPLWDDLGRFAQKHLKVGGVLLAMTPAPYLPQILEMLGKHLTYQWIMACVLPGSHGSVIQSGVRNVIWKPILVYRNGGSPVNIGSDLFENDKRDKDFHEWGQGVGGYLWQIENFTKPNDLVCDQFLGGGTTALASLQLTRRFVGFDADAEKVAITKGRLSNVDL